MSYYRYWSASSGSIGRGDRPDYELMHQILHYLTHYPTAITTSSRNCCSNAWHSGSRQRNRCCMRCTINTIA
ncbi:MAG: hypothetical protein U5P41_08705 [Gammaproteobacteria bacterium]|nr:hypothetical protein [Gammaproteobacteria bacterium]